MKTRLQIIQEKRGAYERKRKHKQRGATYGPVITDFIKPFVKEKKPGFFSRLVEWIKNKIWKPKV